MDQIIVKVARLGSRVVEVALANHTVAAALAAAEMTADGFAVRVNGGEATMASVLSDGDIVTLVPQIKGG